MIYSIYIFPLVLCNIDFKHSAQYFVGLKKMHMLVGNLFYSTIHFIRKYSNIKQFH